MISDRPKPAIGIRGRRYLRLHVLDYIKSVEANTDELALDSITYAFIARFPKPWVEVHDYDEFMFYQRRLKTVCVVNPSHLAIQSEFAL